ncbi:hypothetical protein VTH82DRAFT_28 [Thermothelomyces myriococcoides]
MSFGKFKADVLTTARKVANGKIPGVRSINTGESDGEVVIEYHHDLLADVYIHALAQNVDEYPDENMFILWTDDPDPPAPVTAVVKAAQEYLLGMSVYEMVTELAHRLEKEIDRAGNGEVASLGDFTGQDENDYYGTTFDTDYSSDGDEFGLPSLSEQRSRPRLNVSLNQRELLRRIRRDLREVRKAGYRVGFLDGLGKDSTVGTIALSIRVDKLALSNEAMEAWDVKPTEYIVLLVRFDRQYYPLDQVLHQAASHTRVAFRIGKCNKHKPSTEQAIRAFATPRHFVSVDGREPVPAAEGDRSETRFEKLLISNSLDSFMCASFVSLLKIREARCCSWEKANDVLLSRMSLVAEESWADGSHSDADPNNTAPEPEPIRVLGEPDHLLQKHNESERSFPLIAVQFAIRYFVRCTEYCLRCHRPLERGFEALRPYVCSDPLCLFQYMAMGLGPSIEHEILTEPYVVDLLVSLCYAAIQPVFPNRAAAKPSQTTHSKFPIRSFPAGLRLRVPDLTNPTAVTFKGRLSADGERVVFEDEIAESFNGRLASGIWLAFRDPVTRVIRHARVKEVYGSPKTAAIEVIGDSAVYWTISQYSPQYLLDQQASSRTPDSTKPSEETDGHMVEIYLYDTEFDSLDDMGKAAAMRHVLDTLPPILDIEEWLASHPGHSFRAMGRISPAAASLLQWIVSSNRSCILQVDRSRALAERARAGAKNEKAATSTMATGPSEIARAAGRGKNREHERILGMDGWVQFRFAQGAPDKELRFNRALQEVAARRNISDNPTIFAWHGSNLANWHSILRTGLDFQDINNGRSFGNGVYFSRWQDTSVTYASNGQPWPNSSLGITNCLSLNEIINAPDKFVSSHPHYVVSQLDWHQCRYLFVQTTAGRTNRWAQKQEINSSTATSQTFYPQAEGREAFGQDRTPLKIPLCAIPLRTIGSAPTLSPDSAKRAMLLLEESEDEDSEDESYLMSDDEDDNFYKPPSKRTTSRASSMSAAELPNQFVKRDGSPISASISSVSHGLTKFEPGKLDFSTLPRLKPPSFATNAATKSLSRELRHLQALQAKTPLHELGWYIDFDNVSNLYQWIVELHSFDVSLPLAQDMELAKVTSVVLEMRFGPEFPFSPPFVRVIRPRFLPFIEGGGGHVTAGGAMCMELLTESGWSPANSMESVLLQVRMALCNMEPRPARLNPRLLRNTGAHLGQIWDYNIGEAIEAFTRAAISHGWTVPKELKLTAMGV